MYAEHIVVARMARNNSRFWFPQHLHQSTHLRSTLRGFQVVAEEDAEDRQHRYNRGSAGQMIRLQAVKTRSLSTAQKQGVNDAYLCSKVIFYRKNDLHLRPSRPTPMSSEPADLLVGGLASRVYLDGRNPSQLIPKKVK